MSARHEQSEVVRSPLRAPTTSQSSFNPQSASPLTGSGTAASATRSAAPTDSAASFDELVYQFTTSSKTLSNEERLGFLKQSKASLEKMESAALRQSVEPTQRARERALRASRPTPRNNSPSPPVTSAARTDKRDSLSTNTPLPSASAGNRQKGLFLVLDEEVVREEQLRKHPHSIAFESPAQIYSKSGEGAVSTPQKVTLGTDENPTVLNDFFPEPVRNRHRRRGSYAKYQPTADAITTTAMPSRGGLSPGASAHAAGIATPRTAGGQTSRRASIVVLAVNTPDDIGPSTVLHGDQQNTSVPPDSDASLRSPTTDLISPAAAVGGVTSPSASNARPLSLHTCVLSHLSASGHPSSATAPTTTAVRPLQSRARSAGGNRRQSSFTSGKRSQTPQTRGACSGSPTPPVPLSAGITPPDTSLAAATLTGAANGHRSRRGSTQTPRRGSMRARSMTTGAEGTPRTSHGSERGPRHGRTTSNGSVSATHVHVPMLDTTFRHASAHSAPLTPVLQSPIRSPHEGRPSAGPNPVFESHVGTASPRAGARTARTRTLYQAQRSAILTLVNEEIRHMQGADPLPSSQQDDATPLSASASPKEAAHRSVGETDPQTHSATAPPEEAIHTEDVSAFPDVTHALHLLAGNASSAYNWVMLAEAMSEAQLLPPRKVRVVYTPDSEASISASQASPSSLSVDAQGMVTRWIGMKEALVEALNIDNEMKNAWEGLALLLGPDEKVVVRKALTGRPITVNNVACYIRLLRSDPAYFYGWMGLGCAIVEEQKRLVEEARAAEAQTKAMEALADQVTAQEQQQYEREADEVSPAAASPPQSQFRRGRREPALTLDDGLRLLEEEERNAKRAAAATRTGCRSSKTPRSTEPSGVRASRANGAGDATAERQTLSASAANGSDVGAASAIPAVTHDVLFGKRPFEAKDCFAHAAQLCPWEKSIWLQILMSLPDGAAVVEFDAPADEREWADIMAQRAAMEALGGDVMGPSSVTADEEALDAAEALRRRMIALDDERLLKGCVLNFAEVAGIALELNSENKDVWRYVGERLAPTPDASDSVKAGRTRRGSTVKQYTTMTSAGLFVTTIGPGASGGQGSVHRRPRRNSVKAPESPAAVAPTTVPVHGELFTRVQCFRRAKELAARHSTH